MASFPFISGVEMYTVYLVRTPFDSKGESQVTIIEESELTTAFIAEGEFGTEKCKQIVLVLTVVKALKIISKY